MILDQCCELCTRLLPHALELLNALPDAGVETVDLPPVRLVELRPLVLLTLMLGLRLIAHCRHFRVQRFLELLPVPPYRCPRPTPLQYRILLGDDIVQHALLSGAGPRCFFRCSY